MALESGLFSEKIKDIFSKLANINAQRMIAISASDTVKVRLEPLYDKLFGTEMGQRIRALPPGAKSMIEFVVYGVHGLLDSEIEPKSALGVFLREVVEDMPAEFGRRMLNNGLRYPDTAESADATSVINPSLLTLKPDEIESFTNWFSGLTDSQRVEARSLLGNMSIDSLQAMVALDEPTRTVLIEMLASKKSGPAAPIFPGIKRAVDELNRDLDDVLERTRQRREARRKRNDKE